MQIYRYFRIITFIKKADEMVYRGDTSQKQFDLQ